MKHSSEYSARYSNDALSSFPKNLSDNYTSNGIGLSRPYMNSCLTLVYLLFVKSVLICNKPEYRELFLAEDKFQYGSQN